MLTLLAAAALALSPVPEDIPNIAFWERIAGRELVQKEGAEPLLPGADPFIRWAGLCPEKGPCAWTLKFEDRRNRFVYQGKVTWGFGIRFVFSNADGRRAEGLAYYDSDRGFYHFTRKNNDWLREEPGSLEYEQVLEVGKALSAFGDAVMKKRSEEDPLSR